MRGSQSTSGDKNKQTIYIVLNDPAESAEAAAEVVVAAEKSNKGRKTITQQVYLFHKECNCMGYWMCCCHRGFFAIEHMCIVCVAITFIVDVVVVVLCRRAVFICAQRCDLCVITV